MGKVDLESQGWGFRFDTEETMVACEGFWAEKCYGEIHAERIQVINELDGWEAVSQEF